MKAKGPNTFRQDLGMRGPLQGYHSMISRRVAWGSFDQSSDSHVDAASWPNPNNGPPSVGMPQGELGGCPERSSSLQAETGRGPPPVCRGTNFKVGPPTASELYEKKMKTDGRQKFAKQIEEKVTKSGSKVPKPVTQGSPFYHIEARAS